MIQTSSIKRFLFLTLLIITFMVLSTGLPEISSAQQHDDPEAFQEWYNNKYSMFIHWGLYSELGGVWNGEPVTRGYSEQIQSHGGIHSDLYAQVADRFNPEVWNPKEIMELAKNAGMRSVVITAKHHDGFALFDSQYTDFNIVEATPYGRDVIKELAEAAERHGLHFGLYFSLIDWHYPPAYPISSHNADPIPDQHHQYNLNQVRELLTNYGPISELWFDMGSLTPEQSRELRELVHTLQPGCMVSGRIGNDMGDFTVMGDNQYPDFILDTPWQTPASIFDETWGYRSWQQRGSVEKKVDEKLESLIRVIAGGGNYLLNIGPRGDGSVVEFERDVLLEIGQWLQINGEAIYNTSPAGLEQSPDWGEVTSSEDKLYLHILDPAVNGSLNLEGISGTIGNSYFLDQPDKELTFNQTNSGIEVDLTDNGSNQFRVVVLDFEDSFQIIPQQTLSLSSAQGQMILDRQNSRKHHSFSGVDYYSSFRSTVKNSWLIEPVEPDVYDASVFYSDGEKSETITLTTPNGTKKILLQGGELIDLGQQQSDIEFGIYYLNGPRRMMLDDVPEQIDAINPGNPWPADSDQHWEPINSSNGELTDLPVRRNDNWFVWQEIESATDQDLFIEFEKKDGIQVFLNGHELYIHNNPERSNQMKDLVLLPLREGTNELLVKFYNRFNNRMNVSLNNEIPQRAYKLPLKSIRFEGGEIHEFSLEQSDPVSIHSNLAMPNVRIILKPE